MSNASAPRRVVLAALFVASLACAQTTYQGVTAEEWIAQLEKDHPAAAGALVSIGAEAIPGLVRVVKNPTAKHRMKALEVLADLHPDPEVAAPALSACLTDLKSGVRAEALRHLDKFELDPSLLPHLIACLRDEDRAYAPLEAISRLGAAARSAIPAIVPLLSNSNESTRCAAAKALGSVGPAAHSVLPALADLLADPKCARAAVIAIRRIGPKGERVADALVRALESTEYGVADEAKAALARMGLLGARRLGEALERGKHVRDTFALMGEDAADAALIVARSSEDEGAYGWPFDSAHDVLLSIGPSAVRRLEEALRSADMSDRMAAAKALRSLATEMPEALAALGRMGDHADAAVRAEAGSRFEWVDLSSREEFLTLAHALGDKDPQVAGAAWGAAVRNRKGLPSVASLLLDTVDRAAKEDRRKIVSRIGEAFSDITPRIEMLQKSLAVDDDQTHEGAVSAISELATQAPEAVPILVALLDHAEDVIRWSAVRGIAQVGPTAKDATTALTSHLSKAVGNKRAECLLALARVGADAEIVGPHLGEIWGDKDLRRTAQEVFLALGDKGIPWLIRAYDQADEKGRLDVVRLIHELLPSSPRTVELALHILQENSTLIREVARALQPAPLRLPVGVPSSGHLRERAEEDAERARRSVAASSDILRWLALRLEGQSIDLGVECAETLSQLSPDIDDALPELARALGGDPSVAMRAMRALQRASLKGAEAAAGVLNDARPQARAAALDVIAQIGADASPVAAQVIRMLHDSDAKVRRRAILACAQIGAGDVSMVSSLVTLIGGRDTEVALAALVTLRGIGPAAEEVVPTVALRLGDENEKIRLEALLALAAITPDDSATRAAVLAAICDRDVDVRRAALGVATKWGPDPEHLLPILVAALSGEGDTKRAGAARLLGELGPVAASAAEPLVEAARKGPPAVRVETVRALGAIGMDPAKLDQALHASLVDEDYRVRAAAAALLRPRTGPHEEVPHVLVDLLSDKYEAVRLEALGALSRFGTLSSQDAKQVHALHRQSWYYESSSVQRERLALALARSGLVDDAILRDVLQLYLSGDAAPDDAAVSALVRDGRRTARRLARMGGGNEAGVALFRRLGADAAAAAPALAETLRENEESSRVGAARMLAASPAAAREVQPVLWEALWHRDPMVRVYAAQALMRTGTPPKRFLAMFEREIRLRSEGCAEAVRGLGEMGPVAATALPALRKILPGAPYQCSPFELLFIVEVASAIRQIDPSGEDPWPATAKPLRDWVSNPMSLRDVEYVDGRLVSSISDLLSDADSVFG